MATTAPQIKKTAKLDLFERSDVNRPVNLGRHGALRESMEQYGFLKAFPIVVVRGAETGKFKIKDGQHRYTIAAELGIPIWYVESDQDFDVALINTAAKKWLTDDYAHVHAAAGNKAYQEGMDFAKAHGLPLGITFALLGGTVSIKNIWADFIAGRYLVKDSAWAQAVAQLHNQMILLAPAVKCRAFLLACMAVCRVPGFDAKRMIEGAKKCREKLVAFGSRDACLAMLEQVYNFRRSNLVGLKAQAEMVMRDRDPTLARKKAG